jgi:Fe-S-cluster containining protein
MSFDCQACGACCYGGEEYVSVTGLDLLRLSPRRAGRYVVTRRDRSFMKMVNGHCAALHARAGHYSCRVYGERPQACQVVEVGSRECLDARRRRGVS